jgi:hypothetical protein
MDEVYNVNNNCLRDLFSLTDNDNNADVYTYQEFLPPSFTLSRAVTVKLAFKAKQHYL